MAITSARGSLSRHLRGLPRRLTTRRFIPDGDVEFADMARGFAEQIKRDPGRFSLSSDDAEKIEQAVIEFRNALAKARHRATRSMRMTMQKDAARVKAEAIVRKFGTLIRLNDQISAADKIRVGVHERRKPVRRAKSALLVAPTLRFVGTTGEGAMCGHKHILRFRDFTDEVGRPRADGAARLELFVELVEPEAPIPAGPMQLSGGRGWYLRSYTRSPIHVEFPVTRQPMRVVYWARWADAQGNVGPFCEAVAARVEGWDGGGKALPNFMEGRQRQQWVVITSARRELPDYATDVQQVEEAQALLPAPGDAAEAA